jgi:TolB protein
MKTLSRILFIALIIAAFGCEEMDLGWLEPDSKILFISRRTEGSADWSLMTMNWDGTEQKRIVDLTVRCSKPVVSHDGDRVLFVHYSEKNMYELYVTNVDGTNLTLIDSAKRYCGSAVWAHDDTRICYSRSRNRNTDDRDLLLYHFDIDQKESLITSGNNTPVSITSNNEIVFCAQNDGLTSDIYSMDMDGSNIKLLNQEACNLVYSPNGDRIAFCSTIGNDCSQIFVSDSDGSDKQQLTSNCSPRVWPGWLRDGNGSPCWTPDGSKIVFVSWEDEDPEIHIMDIDGSNQKKLTDTDGRDEGPSVSKNGKYILFSSKRDLEMNAEIYLMKINGRGQIPLSDYSGADIYPQEISGE